MLSNHCDPNPEIQNTQFATLQLTSRNIRILDKIRPSFCFISQLYLDHNQLITLNGIQQFQNLEVLSFNFNHVGAFSQLNKINNKFFVKQLSFIGNPLQSDPRANFNFLAAHSFTNLSSLNPISSHKLKQRFSKRNLKIYDRSIKNASQSQNEGKTQRYQAQLNKNQLLHTRRNLTRTQNNQKYLQKNKTKQKHIWSSSKIRQYQFEYENEKKTNMSTTANRYKQHQHINNSGSLGNRPRNHTEHKQVKIQPFNTIQQPDQRININKIVNRNRQQQYQQQPQQSQQDLQQQSKEQISQQSPIQSNRQQNSISVFNRTGYFQDTSLIDQFIRYKKARHGNSRNQSRRLTYRQQDDDNQYRPLQINRNNKFKNLAIQFLQQQKIVIAEAFRIRHIKQQVFCILRNLKQNKYKEQLHLKQKAWATIKMYNTINKIYNQNKIQ